MAVADPQHQSDETSKPDHGLPDYVLDPNAVLKDSEAKWRYGRAPDYSKTRAVYADSKKFNHEPQSLPNLVENLVKNWEVEASFKIDLKDWRTVDYEKYSFGINGGPPQSGEDMLRVGTYNAIIAPNEYYSPEHSDFGSSHKTFKRMMPTFAWEVVEVYSGPPVVSFRWRHWGTMKNDYVGFNDKGEKVTAKAHGGLIDIEGITIAKVNEKLQIEDLMTWFDPLEMFRQIAPGGIVNKVAVPGKVGGGVAPQDIYPEVANQEHFANISEEASTGGCPFLHSQAKAAASKDDTTLAQAHSVEAYSVEASQNGSTNGEHPEEDDEWHPAEETQTPTAEETTKPALEQVQPDRELANGGNTHTESSGSTVAPVQRAHTPQGDSKGSRHDTPAGSPQRSIYTSAVTGPEEPHIEEAQETERHIEHLHDQIDDHLEQPAEIVHPHPHNVEEKVEPNAGEAVVIPPSNSKEINGTFEEMSKTDEREADSLMNRE